MDVDEHLRLTGGALKRWFIAQTQDAIIIGLVWLIGLLIIGVPWAPVWAVIGGLAQYVPNVGPVIGLMGPAVTAGLAFPGWMHLLYVLILYVVIVVLDGLIIQPYLLKRHAKVPIWASIVTPIVLGLLFPPWGVLIAAPLLSVIYTYRARLRQPPPQS